MIWLLLKRFWPVLAGMAVVGVAWYAIQAYGDRRYDAGVAKVRGEWNAAVIAANAVAAKELARNLAKDAEDAIRNEGIERDYQSKLAAAESERDRTFSLLQQARAAATRSAAREATSAIIASTAGEASITERIDRATAGVRAEGQGNADQLDALIAVVVPQM